jgi:hypothetical protein
LVIVKIYRIWGHFSGGKYPLPGVDRIAMARFSRAPRVKKGVLKDSWGGVGWRGRGIKRGQPKSWPLPLSLLDGEKTPIVRIFLSCMAPQVGPIHG